MEVSLILLQTLDSFIAKDGSDNLNWGTKADKDFFRSKTKEIGTMILGSKTFDNMPPGAFKNKFSLILTSRKDYYTKKYSDSNLEFMSAKPKKCLEFLEKKGISEVALIGGGMTNRSFLEAGLVNKIFITLAPKIFFQGITAFNQTYLDSKSKNSTEINLELENFEKISQNELLITYKVLS